MALNKQALKQGIIDLQKDMLTKTNASTEEYAERLATLIDTFVRGGEVTIPAGIPVGTAGTAAAQTGKTTAPVKGAIT